MTHYLGDDGDLTFAQLIRLFREERFLTGSVLYKKGQIVYPRVFTEEERRHVEQMKKFFDDVFDTGEEYE